MKFRSRLSHRIILSVVLLTTIVSGLFALGVTAAIHFVEESIVTKEMQKEFAQVFEDFQNGQDLRLEEGVAFFLAGPTLPDYLRSLPGGYTEIVLDDRAYFAYHRVEGATSYFLVKDQTDFEREESLLLRAVFGGFVLCVLISIVLAMFIVKQVIAPVRKLTQQVADREALSEQAPPLAAEYADDEVGALAKAFDATFARLQQALRREALFTSDVSHELRTPLMVIQSTCEVLVARKDLDDYTCQKIDTIHRGTKEIKSLIEAFLALARGKDSPSEKATLDSIVESHFLTWEQMARHKDNRLLLQDEGRSPAQKAMEYPTVLLRTAIDNLIRNAIHHTAGGEITLILDPDGMELRDTGSGIAVDDLSKVFQPYYRGTGSHREGLGLGLSLVQRICERENWQIFLEQNYPTGCRFRINFA